MFIWEFGFFEDTGQDVAESDCCRGPRAHPLGLVVWACRGEEGVGRVWGPEGHNGTCPASKQLFYNVKQGKGG